MINFPVQILTTPDSRKWIQTLNAVQFAYCLYLQPAVAVRDNNGFIKSLSIETTEEQHATDCKNVLSEVI